MSSKKYRWGYKYQGESEPCIGTAGFCGTKSNLYGMVFWHMYVIFSLHVYGSRSEQIQYKKDV